MGSNHARVISQSGHSRLSVIVDPDERVGQSIASRHSTIWAPKLEDFSNLDYVVVASPSQHHFTIAMNAISADVPVLIEKPISNTFAETMALVSAARERNIPLTCGLVERFNPAFLTLKKIVSEMISIHTVRHSPYSPRISSSVTSDLLIHDLDLAINLFGSNPLDLQLKSLSLNHESLGVPDAVDLLAGFSDSRFGNMSVSRIGHRKIRTMSILEKDRLIEVDMLRRDITIYKHLDEDVSTDGLGYKQQTIIEIPGLITNEEPLMAQLNSFSRSLVNRDKGEVSSELDSILNIHRWLEEIEKIENCSS
jgi:predicted dehydrogenase